VPPGYLKEARELTRQAGALLIIDEVQTGVCRTGPFLAHHLPRFDSVEPDIVTLAKGLGSGLPIGAFVAYGDAATLLHRGEHGSTFAGNPVVAAAALATIATLNTGLSDDVARIGQVLRQEIEMCGAALVREVRGEGLLLGVVLNEPRAAELTAAALDAGFIVNAVAPDVIRLTPPLILTEDQAREAAQFFATPLEAARD
jgi:acetylornithine aminotransferase